MLARCARCQGTFTTDHYGRQTCPHCGSELLLQDPAAQPPAQPPPAGEGGEAGAPAPEPRGVGAAGPPPGAAGPAQGGWGPPPSPPGWGPPPPQGGWGPPPGGWGPGGTVTPPGGWGPPPPPGDGIPAPFAERATRGFLASFFETWKLALLRSQDFFRRVRVDQTGSAVLFAVLASTVGSWIQALTSAAMNAGTLAQFEQSLQTMPPDLAESFEKLRPFFGAATGAALVGQLLAAPVVALLGLYLSAGIVHLLLLLFRGAPRGFDGTLTVAGYASAANLLLVVPGCGWLVALVWWTVAMVVGLAEAQRCGTGKALAAVLLPGLLLCLCCAALAGLAGFAAFQQAAGTTAP